MASSRNKVPHVKIIMSLMIFYGRINFPFAGISIHIYSLLNINLLYECLVFLLAATLANRWAVNPTLNLSEKSEGHFMLVVF